MWARYTGALWTLPLSGSPSHETQDVPLQHLSRSDICPRCHQPTAATPRAWPLTGDGLDGFHLLRHRPHRSTWTWLDLHHVYHIIMGLYRSYVILDDVPLFMIGPLAPGAELSLRRSGFFLVLGA